MNGVYTHPDKGRQLIRFDGIQYGKISPTDIDGIIEYHDRIWIIYEAKYRNSPLCAGQRTLLERFVRCMGAIGKHAIAVICEHDVADHQDDVYLAHCPVRAIYNTENMVWRPPSYAVTVKQISDLYIRRYMTECEAKKGA